MVGAVVASEVVREGDIVIGTLPMFQSPHGRGSGCEVEEVNGRGGRYVHIGFNPLMVGAVVARLLHTAPVEPRFWTFNPLMVGAVVASKVSQSAQNTPSLQPFNPLMVGAVVASLPG